MLCYHDSFTDNNLVFSIDNIVLDLWISNSEAKDFIEASILNMCNDVTIVEWESNKPGTFRQQYSFRLSEGISFWMGCGLVSSGVMIDRYRLEFNPNKVGGNPIFKKIHRLLVSNSRESLNRITRFDFAIDVPVDRAQCFLVKDRRLYIERKHGVEYTQYLGSKSSAVGRVKLYNKTAEAKLDYPLTRLELTLNPVTPYEEVNFPTVYYLKPIHEDRAGVKITDTERFIVNALLQGYGTLNDLGRKTRAKIELLMQNYVEKIDITPAVYAKVQEKLSCYMHGNTDG